MPVPVFYGGAVTGGKTYKIVISAQMTEWYGIMTSVSGVEDYLNEWRYHL